MQAAIRSHVVVMRYLLWTMVFLSVASEVLGQEPVILTFDVDGSLTWSNALSDGIASIEQLTDVATTGSAVMVTETLGITDGSTVVYNYAVDHPPIVSPSVTISDGTYSWNDVTLSSSPADFIATVSSYGYGQVSVVYLSEPPAQGTLIEVEYSYLPVSTHREWLSMYAHPATSELSQATVDMGKSSGLFRIAETPPIQPLPGFSLIPAGTFVMGSPEREPGRYLDETQHQVTLTRDYFMHTTEITNRQMADVLNWAIGQRLVSADSASVLNVQGSQQTLLDLAGPHCQISYSRGSLVVDAGADDYPCGYVSWYGAQAYCSYLSDMEGLPRAVDVTDWSWTIDSRGYRLPTEAEWEYACRAGTTTAFYTGEITDRYCSPSLDAAGWYKCNSANPSHPIYEGRGTHPVGLKRPNEYGLFDMHGNVVEWCGDWHASYPGDVTDPIGPASGGLKAYRGAAFNDRAEYCRSASRHEWFPDGTDSITGFRPARSAVP